MMHSGVLRAYGNDISRLQRLIDPFLLAGLFVLCTHASGVADQQDRLLVSALLWVVVLSAVVLPINKLYQSYRQLSLVTLLTAWCCSEIIRYSFFAFKVGAGAMG